MQCFAMQDVDSDSEYEEEETPTGAHTRKLKLDISGPLTPVTDSSLCLRLVVVAAFNEGEGTPNVYHRGTIVFITATHVYVFFEHYYDEDEGENGIEKYSHKDALTELFIPANQEHVPLPLGVEAIAEGFIDPDTGMEDREYNTRIREDTPQYDVDHDAEEPPVEVLPRILRPLVDPSHEQAKLRFLESRVEHFRRGLASAERALTAFIASSKKPRKEPSRKEDSEDESQHDDDNSDDNEVCALQCFNALHSFSRSDTHCFAFLRIPSQDDAAYTALDGENLQKDTGVPGLPSFSMLPHLHEERSLDELKHQLDIREAHRADVEAELHDTDIQITAIADRIHELEAAQAASRAPPSVLTKLVPPPKKVYKTELEIRHDMAEQEAIQQMIHLRNLGHID